MIAATPSRRDSGLNAQTAIPCMLMRGGTSKGAYFIADDLPTDTATRDRVLLAALGSPDARQIDGIGGADPLTSKVAIVAVAAAGRRMSTSCSRRSSSTKRASTPRRTAATSWPASRRSRSNAAWCRRADRRHARAHLTVNTGHACGGAVETPAAAQLRGDARINGVPGRPRPSRSTFSTSPARSAARCCPTGNVADVIDGVSRDLHRQRDARRRHCGARSSASPATKSRGG